MTTAKGAREVVTLARVERERNRKRAEALLRRIEKLRASLSRDFYELGQCLEELSRSRLYGALGYDAFEQLLEARIGISRTQAGRLVAVFRAFPREQALALGVEKAYGLLRYAAATPADDVATVLAATNARIDGKPLRALSTRELAAVTRKVAARRATRDPELRTARRKARETERTARGRGAAGAIASARRVLGKTWIRIEVPLEELEALLGGDRRA